MVLHIFNPEHDLALAADSPHWTSPHAGRQLRSDLCWLPALWAEEGDVILVDDVDAASAAYARLKYADKRSVCFDSLRTLPANAGNINKVSPWGWDRPLVHQLQRIGIPDSLLPSQDVLDAQRILSDRVTAKRILDDMNNHLGSAATGSVRVVTSTAELPAILNEWGRVVLKAPWSSSGRGVRFVTDLNANNIIRWAEKIINTQGHLMVERYLDKILDFGMEFTAFADGTIRYDGLSLFKTENSAYTGSILATEQEKQDILSRYISSDLTASVQQYICNISSDLLPLKGIYEGPFGIDMMVVASPTSQYPALLNPCVELNLRRTMGHVALSLSPSVPSHQLLMRVGYEGTNYHLRLFNDHEIFA